MCPASPAIRVRVAVLVRCGDAILLVRHEKQGRSYWLLPGGGLEYGESLADAARREALEEMGLDLEVGKIAKMWESLPPDRSRHVLNIVFEARVIGGELQVPLGDERLREARYVSRDELTGLPMHPPLAPYLLDWLDGADSTLHLGSLWSDS